MRVSTFCLHAVSRATVLIAICLTGAACTRSLSQPDLGGIYNRAAQDRELERNPIVVMPGLLGSRLSEAGSGRVVWGAFAPFAAGVSEIALPIARNLQLDELRDTLVPDEVLDRVRVTWLRLTVEQKAYFHLLGALGAGGYRDENLARAGAIDYGTDHFTCFQFPYDWRRDLVESARKLDAFLREKRAFLAGKLREQYGREPGDIRFDVVAHSMGGLVLRYYLRYGTAEPPPPGVEPSWAGAELVDRAILVGTPNAGSLNALQTLIEGERLSWVLPRYDASVVGTFPSLYQLLPRARHGRVIDSETGETIDVLDPEEWALREWGLSAKNNDEVLSEVIPGADPAERRRAAADHQRKAIARASRVLDALDRPAVPPAGLTLHLMAGDAEATASVVSVDDGGKIRVVETKPGDGVVLRESAVLDERPGGTWVRELQTPIDWNRVTFLFGDHLGMTRDPAFVDNLLYVLLEEPRLRPAGLIPR